MAWNASGTCKTPTSTHAHTHNDASFPGLRPETPDALHKNDHTELQENELVALEAIYGDDFVNHTGEQTAWKVPLYTPHTDIPYRPACQLAD